MLGSKDREVSIALSQDNKTRFLVLSRDFLKSGYHDIYNQDVFLRNQPFYGSEFFFRFFVSWYKWLF